MIAEDKLFGCPFCGHRIGPSDSSCPRCGNTFGSGTKLECPFCGDLVEPGASECPSCHIDFAEFQEKVKGHAKKDSIDSLLMEIIQLEAKEVKEQRKTLSCPNCDLLLDGSESECPRCKTNLEHGLAFQCPTCGAFVDPEANECSECKAQFAFEERAETTEQHHNAVSATLDEILTSTGYTEPVLETVEEEEPELSFDVRKEVVPEKTNNASAPAKKRQRKLKSKPSGGAKKPARKA